MASINVLAQDAPPMPPGGQPGGGMRMQFQMPSFADLDKNKDKKISKDEFPSQFPPQMFDRMDTNQPSQLIGALFGVGESEMSFLVFSV